MLASTLADEWMFDRLVSDPTVASVVGDKVGNATDGIPDSWATPYVMYAFVDDDDKGGIGNPVTAQFMRYQVEFVWEPTKDGTPDTLLNAAHAMDARLDFASETLVGGQEVSSQRISEIVRRQSRDGERLLRHLGADYRVFVSAP